MRIAQQRPLVQEVPPHTRYLSGNGRQVRVRFDNGMWTVSFRDTELYYHGVYRTVSFLDAMKFGRKVIGL